MGAIGAGVYIFLAPVVGDQLAALAAVMFWIATEQAERLVLRVPRQWIAVAFVAASWLVVLLRIGAPRVLVAAVASHAISRAGAIALTWVSRPAANGFALSRDLTTTQALLAIILGTVAGFLAGIRGAPLLVAAAYLLLRIIQEWWYRRRGGMDARGFAVAQSALQIMTMLIWICFFEPAQFFITRTP